MTLKDAGVLTQTNHQPARFPPGCPFETTSVHELLQSVRTADESQFINPSILPAEPVTQQLMHHIDETSRLALENMTLREFVLGGDIALPTESCTH